MVIEHVESERVPAALEAAGGWWMSVRRFLGQGWPDVARLDGVIVLGGPGPSADDDAVAHLVDERALIADAVRDGLSVLGYASGHSCWRSCWVDRLRRPERPRSGSAR
jgi:hypothetical protein